MGPFSGFDRSRWLARIVAGGFVFAGALVAEPVFAGGIGGSLSFGRSDARLEDRDDVFVDLDTQTDAVGLGVVFDTNLAQDRLFNYRVAAGLDLVDQEIHQAGIQNQVQGASFYLDQTLGFGFIRTPELRVWIGPSIHLGVGEIDDHIDVDGFRADYDETSFTAGIGPELGVNFHVGRHLTFSTSTFVRYGVRVQDFDTFYDDRGSDGVFTGDELQAGVRTSIFFRFGRDAYDPRYVH